MTNFENDYTSWIEEGTHQGIRKDAIANIINI